MRESPFAPGKRNAASATTAEDARREMKAASGVGAESSARISSACFQRPFTYTSRVDGRVNRRHLTGNAAQGSFPVAEV